MKPTPAHITALLRLLGAAEASPDRHNLWQTGGQCVSISAENEAAIVRRLIMAALKAETQDDEEAILMAATGIVLADLGNASLAYFPEFIWPGT